MRFQCFKAARLCWKEVVIVATILLGACVYLSGKFSKSVDDGQGEVPEFRLQVGGDVEFGYECFFTDKMMVR